METVGQRIARAHDAAVKMLDEYGEGNPSVRRHFLRNVRYLARIPLYDVDQAMLDMLGEVRRVTEMAKRVTGEPF